MSDTKQLSKEHDNLKNQMKNFIREHEALRSIKMAGKLDKSSSATTDDVQCINLTVEELVVWKQETLQMMDNFRDKLNDLNTRVNSMSKAIDQATAYSYQYNLKILGVSQLDERERESGEKTTELCVSMFNKMEVKVSEGEIKA